MAHEQLHRFEAGDAISPMTIGARQHLRLEKLLRSVDTIANELRHYARLHGGSFVIFGSVARGEARHDSDLDILIDFSGSEARPAWFFAEAMCTRHGVRPDLHLVEETAASLLARARAEGFTIS